MSIYGTIFSLDGENHDVERCEAFYEESDGLWDFTGRACSCGAWNERPIVYEGSHVLPSDEDRRGGYVEVAEIPSFITRDSRDDAPDGALKDWLRLGIGSCDSLELYEGKPYVRGGDATVMLDRPLVERLRDALTAWLEREA